jgi:hypothetical protein
VHREAVFWHQEVFNLVARHGQGDTEWRLDYPIT